MGNPPDRWTGQRRLGGLLVAIGALGLAFVGGFGGWVGVLVFLGEVALVFLGGALLWWAGRR